MKHGHQLDTQAGGAGTNPVLRDDSFMFTAGKDNGVIGPEGAVIVATRETGGGQPFNIMQPYLVIGTAYIKL